MGPDTVIAGKYRLVRHLGDGAMGSVWEAKNELTQRSFAIKLIQVTGGEAEELRQRMLREASAAGRLHHRNVIEVYDVGETESGDPFLVMELLRGETLEALMDRRGRLSTAAVAAIGAEVAKALDAAHEASIVHRDLKPANVFLHQDPDRGIVVKVLDFGVSKVISEESASSTVTGTAVGSPAYMSPEQAMGSRVDHRTDVWSLGVLLYEMASGKGAFDGDTPYAVVAGILQGPLPALLDAAPGADPRLDGIIRRCMVRDPNGRFPGAREVGAELETLLPGRPEVVLEDLEEAPTLARDARDVSQPRIVLPAAPAMTANMPLRQSLPSFESIAIQQPAPETNRMPLLIGIAAGTLVAAGILVFLLISTLHKAPPAPPVAPVVAVSQQPAATPEPAPVASSAPPVVEPAPPTSASEKPPLVKKPAVRVYKPLPACPPDKVFFGPDGKKRCVLPGHVIR